MTDQRPPRTVQDLVKVTGLSVPTVREAIRRGELPGYHVGQRYIVPADAYDAFCAGTWKPSPRRMFERDITPLPQPSDFLKKTKESA